MTIENVVYPPAATDKSGIITVTSSQPKKDKFRFRDIISKFLSKKNDADTSTLVGGTRIQTAATQPTAITSLNGVSDSQQVVHSFSPRESNLGKKIHFNFLTQPRKIVIIIGIFLLGIALVVLLTRLNTRKSAISEVPYLISEQEQSKKPETSGYVGWQYTTWGNFSFYYPFDLRIVNGNLSTDHFVLAKTYSDNPVSFIQIEGLVDPVNNNLKLAVDSRKRGKGTTSMSIRVLSDQANGKDKHILVYEWLLSAVTDQKIVTYEYFNYSSFLVRSLRVNAPELTWSTNSQELMGIINAIVY